MLGFEKKIQYIPIIGDVNYNFGRFIRGTMTECNLKNEYIGNYVVTYHTIYSRQLLFWVLNH